MITISTEDYLKVIYAETKPGGNSVSTSKLAEKLGISSAAITDMVKKLAKQGYVDYAKYKGMALTRKGEKVALKVIRRHRLWEAFLIKSLGFSWSEVHPIAEKLEHNSPDVLIEKIDEYLDFPDYDPHGHPIPKKNGEMPKLTGLISLNDGIIGRKYQIETVDDTNEELINYFTKIGVILHKVIILIDKLSFDNSCLVKIDKSDYSLSEQTAKKILVTEVSKRGV